MENLFLKVLSMSATASAVILLVLLARLLLRRAPKVFSYALWAVVLFRLLCPVTFDSVFALAPAIQITPREPGRDLVAVDVSRREVTITVGGAPAYDPTPAAPVTADAPPQAAQTRPDPEPGEALPAASAAPGWQTSAAAVWLAGAALLLGYSLVSLLRLRRRLVGWVPLEGEENVRLADHIPSPFVLGLLRPTIYLPSDLPERERDYILLHERTHIRRFDHIFRALAWLAVAVHWFNPLVWLAFHLAGKDMEMSCDETVLRKMGPGIRADYSSSLLRLSVGGRLPAGPLAFGAGDPTGRIKNVLGYKKPALWVVIAALLLVLSACTALAANPGAVTPPSEPDTAPSPDLTADLTFSLEQRDDRAFVRMDGTVGDVELPRGAFWYPEPSAFGNFPNGYLSVVYPAFTDSIEGHILAGWADDSRTSVTLSTQMSAMLSSLFNVGWWEFTVELGSGTVTRMDAVSLREGFPDGETRLYPASLSEEEALKAARVAATLLTAAEDFYSNNSAPAATPAPTPSPTPAPAPVSLDGLSFSDGWHESVNIEGLDVKKMYWYSPSQYSPQGQLFFTNPAFFGPAFAGRHIQGDAYWADDSYTQMKGYLSAGDKPLNFTIDMSEGRVSPTFEGFGIPDADMLAMAHTCAVLMERAEAYKTSGAYRPVEDGPLPFDRPMELEFASGAGAWQTYLLLHPDGSFVGEYSDMDMGDTGPGYQSTEYICQFHGRFRDINQVTANSWSLTLDELVLDTGRPIGEEWIEATEISAPYGFDTADGKPLEPGAQFMLYTPGASGYRPTDELYGFDSTNTDYDSLMYQFWSWMPSGHRIGLWGPDTRLGCYGLCSMETGCGFFSD